MIICFTMALKVKIADRNNVASVNLGKKYGFVEDDPNKHGHDWKDDWSKEYAMMYRKLK